MEIRHTFLQLLSLRRFTLRVNAMGLLPLTHPDQGQVPGP